MAFFDRWRCARYEKQSRLWMTSHPFLSRLVASARAFFPSCCSSSVLLQHFQKEKEKQQHGPRISIGPIIGSQQCVRYEQLHDCIAGSELPPRTVSRWTGGAIPAGECRALSRENGRVNNGGAGAGGGAGFWPDKCLRLSGRRPGRMLTCKLHRCPGPSGGA